MKPSPKGAMTQPEQPLISDEYRRQLQEKHGQDDEWGNTGIRYYGTMLQLVDHFGIKSILDYGCGKGTVGKKFREDQQKPKSKYADVQFLEYDPGIDGKTDPTTKAELLINTDVLEHIEPNLIDNVLADMGARTLRIAFMVISCVPAIHRLPDGRNAHLIIEHPNWWIEKLKKYFVVTQAEQKGGELYVMAESKEYNAQKKTVEVKDLHPAILKDIEEKHYSRARIALAKLTDAGAALLRGRIAYENDDPVTAAHEFSECYKISSDAEALKYLGFSMSKLARYAESVKCLETPLCFEKFSADLEFNTTLMTAWNKTMHPQKTIDLFQKFTDADSKMLDAYIQALILNQDYKGALEVAEKSVADHPNDDVRWATLSHACDIHRLFPRALEAALKCVELKDDNAAYHSNLGLAYMHMGDLDNAAASYDRAITMDPILTAAYVNRANIYRLQGDYANEEAELRACLEIDPVMADTHYGLGLSLIRQEKYPEGSAEIEWFWHKNTLTSTRLPDIFRRWYGEPLTNKLMLIYADQGIGDSIMMMRYVDTVLREFNPGKILLNVNVKLRGLFEHKFREHIETGKLEVFDDTLRLSAKDIDFSIALSTLPHALKTRIDTIPESGGYLTKRDTIDYKQGNEKTFVIGLSWYTKSMDAGIYRSLKLMDFAFLGKIPNVRVINLQYGDTAAERASAAAHGFEIYNDDKIDVWNDLQAAADQIAACDLVISIDNTTVHTAGALNKPAWVILPEENYWRWPVTGDATPWYESLRLFRQKKEQSYIGMVDDVEQALKKLLTGDRTDITPAKFRPLFPVAKPAKQALIINDTGTCYTWSNYASLHGLKSGLAQRGFDLRTSHTLELQYFAPSLPELQKFDDPAYLSACRYRDPSLFFHLENCDSIVLNGEGMINNLSEATVQMLYLAYIAKSVFKRRVGMVNFSCFPEGGTELTDANRLAFYLKGLKSLDVCVPREQLSVDLIRSLGVTANLGFDPAVLWLRDYIKNHDLPKRGKTAVISATPGYDTRMAPTYANICKKLAASGIQPIILHGAQYQTAQEDLMLAEDLNDIGIKGLEILKCYNIDDYMTALAGARLAITGFFPTCVLAHGLNVPVLPFSFGTNVVALAGLAKISDIQTPVAYNTPRLDGTLEQSIKDLLNQSSGSKGLDLALLDKLCGMALKNMDAF